MGVEIRVNDNYVATRGLTIVQLRCELAARLLARKLDPVRSEPRAARAFECAVSAESWASCGPNLTVERARKALANAGSGFRG